MLNGVVQPVTDANERCIQTLQPYQSLWLAHWKRAGCDASGDTTTSPNTSRSEGHIARGDGLAKGVETSSRSADGVGLIKKRTFEIGSNFMKIGRKSVGNDRTISYLDGRDADALFRLNPSKESLLESSSHVLPDEFDIEMGKFDKGKAAVSLGSRQRSADMGMLVHNQCCETDVHCERKVGPPSQSDNSSDECLRESVSCDHCSSMINQVWFLKMQKCSVIRLSPSQSNSSEENETTKSHIDCYSKLKVQKCGHGLGMMGICTGVDVPGGASTGFPRFSLTDNDLLITKKTGVNAFKENDVFRSKRVTKSNGNLSGDHSLLPFFGQNKQKVRLQSLSSLNDSKEKEYTRDVKVSKVTIRNESSAETGTMDMDSFKEKKYKKNLHSASNSTASTKAFDMESNGIVSSIKVEQQRPNNKLPNINLERPALPGSPQNTCPSSSKTLTMETNKLFEHVTQPKSKSNFSLDELPNADAGNRWVKRLKISSSNSSTPNCASITPRKGTSKFFNGIPGISTARSISDPRKHHDERQRSLASDKSEDFSKIDEEGHCMENPNDKAKALLLSNAWIQRWLHSGGREAKRGSKIEIICDPKLAVEKLEKEQQFPSIAAMALMAKVLTCFQQCELQKKGSYTVWNTKTV